MRKNNKNYKILNRKKTLYLLAVIALIITGLSAYFVKSQLHINFLENTTLSNYFPFNYLAPNRIIYNPSPGFLLEDNFDSFSVFENWNELWMREEGKVTKHYDSHGLNNTKSMVINSKSDKSWSCSHNKMFRVKKGDIFTFKLYVKLHGNKLSAYVGVAAFDENKNAVSWNYMSEQIQKTDLWINTEKKFSIKDDIAYIRLKLAGEGKGEFRFDNVCFIKNNS